MAKHITGDNHARYVGLTGAAGTDVLGEGEGDVAADVPSREGDHQFWNPPRTTDVTSNTPPPPHPRGLEFPPQQPDVQSPGVVLLGPIARALVSQGLSSHPGRVLLTEVMQPLGVSRNKLARDIDVSVGRISAIVSGKPGITADTALRLAKYFGTTAGAVAQTANGLRPGGGQGDGVEECRSEGQSARAGRARRPRNARVDGLC